MKTFQILSIREWFQSVIGEIMNKEVDRIERDLGNRINNLTDVVNNMSNAIDTLRSAVESEKTVSGSLIELCSSLSAQLKDALANGDQVAIADIANQLAGNTSKLQEAVLRNTPAAAVEPAPVASGEAPAPDAAPMPVEAQTGSDPTPSEPAPAPQDAAPADAGSALQG